MLLGSLSLGPFHSAQALSIAPGRTDVHLLPGQHMNAVLTVINDHPEKMQIDVSERNWFLYEANKNTPVADWLKIHGKTHFTLKPGKSRKVPVTIFCPPKAEGLLVAMASFKFHSEQPTMMTPMISVSIYLTVDGTQHAAGEIKKISVQVWQNTLAAGAEVTATGNVHLRPSGTLTVLDEQGAEAALFRVNEREPVYPGQMRGYVGVRQGENKLLTPGHYTIKVHLVSGDVTLDEAKKLEVLANGTIVMDGEKKPS
jgi:hypothetical protein